MKYEYDTLRDLADDALLGLIIKEKTGTDDMSRLTNMVNMTDIKPADLVNVDGIGPKKALLIAASLELGRRIYTRPPHARTIIKGPEDIVTLVMAEMRFLDREHFRCLFLSRKNHVLGIETISIGGLSSSIAHPREVFKGAILRSAAAIVPIHNHPSGDPAPSIEDITLTKRLIEAGQILGIDVLDHVIIGDGVWVSLKGRGLI